MSKTKKSPNELKVYGTLMVMLSGFLYGMIGYFGIQLYYQGLSVPNMLFWRFMTAAVWMLLFGVIICRNYNIAKDQLGLLLKLSAVGTVSYAGASSFFYLSGLKIGTGPAMVIFFSYPIFVTLFSLFFKQSKMNRYVLISLVMVVTGLMLLNGSGAHDLNNMGIFLAMVASFSYGVYVYYSQHSSSKVDSVWLTLFTCFGCAMISLFFALVQHRFFVPNTFNAWKDILIIGVIATAIPIQLLLNGLKYISSVNASILSVLEPVTTVVVGILFLNESLSAMQVIGILVILSGAMVIQFEKSTEFRKAKPLK